MKIILTNIVFLFIICFVTEVVGQIKGRAIDGDTRQGVSDVTILINGQSKVIKTDYQGYFMLDLIPPFEIFTKHISYIDTNILVINDSSILQIELQHKSFELERVEVNTGYQSIPKERSTGSFTHISNERFEEQVGGDILSRLPAISNGLIADNYTNSQGRLTIRGLSTIRGSKEPLIILDNFPYEGEIRDINPNDVSDITILKDAAASSIWGVRAGNGVIVITTKKGRLGDKLKVNATVYNSIGQRPNIMMLETLQSKDYISVEESLFERGYFNSAINNRMKPPLTPIVELLLLKQNSLIDQETYEKEKSKLEHYDVRKDYLDNFYRPSYNQQYFYSMMGSGKRSSWTTSVGYDNNTSNTFERLERFTLRFQNQWQLSERFNLGGEIYFVGTERHDGRPSYGSISQDNKTLYPYAQFVDEKGIPTSISRKSNSYLQVIEEEGLLMDWTYYPLKDYQLNNGVRKGKSTVINANARYSIMPALNISARYQFLTDNRQLDRIYNNESYFVRNIVNSFSQIKDNQVEYIVPKGSILDYSNGIGVTHNFRTQLDYSKTIDKHEIDALLGAEVRETKNENKTNRIYGLNESNLSVANLDFASQYPNIITGNLTNIQNELSLASTNIRFVSTFANAAYSYDRRYTISGSLRRDATNLFGLKSRDKWNLLWSIGGSWNISHEDFFQIDQVDFVKLRATYGFSGNVDPTMSAVSTIYYRGVNQHNNKPYARFQNYYNPDLSWESISTTNIGLDMGLFRNKINITAEYFLKAANNLFGQEVMDPTAGVGDLIVKNIASMNTKGFDINILSRNISSGVFKWDTEWNLSRSLDRIKEYYLDQSLARYFINPRVIAGIEGRPVYSLHSFEYIGLDSENGNPIGLYQGEHSTSYSNIYNRSLLEDLIYEGPVLPVWSGSFGNMFTYKNVNLNIRFTYKLGHFFRKNSIHYANLYQLGKGHPDFVDRWQSPGDEMSTDIPSMVYPAISTRDNFYVHSAILTQKADHLRLQYINLSYQLNNAKISKLGNIKSTLFFNVDNVGIIWRKNKYGIDPDYYSETIAPPSKVFSFGIKVNM